jgi:hypothetical protein
MPKAARLAMAFLLRDERNFYMEDKLICVFCGAEIDSDEAEFLDGECLPLLITVFFTMTEH